MSDSGSGDSKKAKDTWTIRGKLDKRAFPDLKFSPVFKSLMKIRGLETTDDIMHFVMPSLGDLRDPVLMKGMDAACERISRALERNEKIGLFTDYDVDGVCSAALIYLFFIKLGYPPPAVFIPDRATDGYGLNTRGIEGLHAKGVSLLITADCGINAIEEVVYAKSLGMDVIITDHHEPDTKLPDAYSIINPKQGDCPFSDQDLCGAGVVFHLMVALRAFLRAKGMESLPNLREDLDLVAMATIADVVSLSGINRILVKEGLKVLNEGKRVGISALADVSGIRSTVIARDIGYILGPRINAAGRISNAYKSFELLTTDDPRKARGIAMELHMLNRQRQAEEQKVFKDVLAMVEDSGNTSEAIVVAGTNWHRGVIGIVASRISERFSKPCIVISITDGVGQGSGRSVEGIDLYKAVSKVSHLLNTFGGHTMAVGISIDTEKILTFSEALNSVLALDKAVHKPGVIVDMEISPEDLTPGLLDELEMMGPFGIGNPEPIFMIPKMRVINIQRSGNNGFNMVLKQNDRIFNAVFHSRGLVREEIPKIANVAFTPYKKRLNGYNHLYLNVKAVSPA